MAENRCSLCKFSRKLRGLLICGKWHNEWIDELQCAHPFIRDMPEIDPATGYRKIDTEIEQEWCPMKKEVQNG